MDVAAPSQSADRSKSVEQLEEVRWGVPALSSYVGETVHALRRKPLRDLTDEELRIGLQQQVCAAVLVPLAVERLEHDPLAEARLYRGDLLQSLLEVPASYWQRHPDMRRRAAELAASAFAWAAASADDDWRDIVLPALQEAYDRFTGKLPSRAWLRFDEGQAPPPGSAPALDRAHSPP